MEIIKLNNDLQGIRVLGAGGMHLFQEDWVLKGNSRHAEFGILPLNTIEQ